MKKLLSAGILLLSACMLLPAQQVANVHSEQAGAFIKIYYQLEDSHAGQMYRVQVLCSINGGLNAELQSVSGDVGEYVAGGKPEYMVLWDVLKDVDELRSAEFIVRAEPMDQSGYGSGKSKRPEPTWRVPKFHVLYTMQFPGPHLGVAVGYAGKVGVMATYRTGRGAWEKETDLPLDYIPDDFEAEQAIFGTLFAVRLVNTKNVQGHLLGGMSRGLFAFYTPESNASKVAITHENLIGPEFGIMLGAKFMTVTAGLSHFDPGRVEQNITLNGLELRCMYPLTYFNWGVGFRF
jgi:hypothetical protein